MAGFGYDNDNNYQPIQSNQSKNMTPEQVTIIPNYEKTDIPILTIHILNGQQLFLIMGNLYSNINNLYSNIIIYPIFLINQMLNSNKISSKNQQEVSITHFVLVNPTRKDLIVSSITLRVTEVCAQMSFAITRM